MAAVRVPAGRGHIRPAQPRCFPAPTWPWNETAACLPADHFSGCIHALLNAAIASGIGAAHVDGFLDFDFQLGGLIDLVAT
jgi:hypothetical protein